MLTSTHLLWTFGYALGFIGIYYAYWQLTVGARRRAFIKENGCEPLTAYPTKDPFFGFDEFRTLIKASKERRALEHMASRFDVIGKNTFSRPAMGRTLISTCEPENLKTIQALKFKDWQLPERRKSSFGPLIGPGIFTSNGQEWQHSRELLRPNFVRSQVGDVETFEIHVSHLIDAIPRNGEMVDLQDLFFRLTMDSATAFLFGESTNCLTPGLSTVSASRFAQAFNQCQDVIAKYARYGFLRHFVSKGDFDKNAKFVHDFIDESVDKAIAKRSTLLAAKSEEKARYVFLDELVCQTTDRYRLRSELLHTLLAGRDTTASLLSNVWWTISKRPDIHAALRREVNSLNGERPSFEQLKELKYLRALLNESLRLYPIVPANGRQAVRDTVLPVGGGPDGKAPVFVKKGQVCVWSLWRMHRRTDLYGEDAGEFKPERWLGEKGLRPGWEYLPFNGGPRICLGQQFALTEASYTTVRLMQEFESIESKDPEPWQEWLTLTATGWNGCKVVLTPY